MNRANTLFTLHSQMTSADFGYPVQFRCHGFYAPKYFKIIWLSHILALSVTDECYSRNASCTLILISTFFFINSIFHSNAWEKRQHSKRLSSFGVCLLHPLRIIQDYILHENIQTKHYICIFNTGKVRNMYLFCILNVIFHLH